MLVNGSIENADKATCAHAAYGIYDALFVVTDGCRSVDIATHTIVITGTGMKLVKTELDMRVHSKPIISQIGGKCVFREKFEEMEVYLHRTFLL